MLTLLQPALNFCKGILWHILRVNFTGHILGHNVCTDWVYHIIHIGLAMLKCSQSAQMDNFLMAQYRAIKKVSNARTMPL
jgi:hypothetical protein